MGNGDADSPGAPRRDPGAAVAVEEDPDLSPKAESVHLEKRARKKLSLKVYIIGEGLT